MGKSGGRRKKGGNSGTAPSEASAVPSTTPSPPPHPSVATASPIPNGNGVAGLDASGLLKRAHLLKEEGNRLFQARDYGGALRHYELALRLTPRGHTDRAVFHSNRAACLMQMRPVDHEAVATECSLALQAQPGFPRALLRRARALEALKRYELALQDVQALMAVDPPNSDALDLARRLRAVISANRVDTSASPSVVTADPGSRPSPAALGASAVRVGAPVAGLGPSLPSRPKKTSPPPVPPPPTQQQQYSASTSKPSSKSSQNIHQTSSSALPNGIHPKPLPTPQQQKVPAEIPTSEASLRPSFINSSLDNSKLQQSKGKESSAQGPVTSWRPLKLVYDHDIRLAQMPANCSFKILREIVANRFPSSQSVLIKYRDADGDLVTVTSTAELRLAESSVDQLNKKEGAIIDKNDKQKLLRLHIVEVSSEQEPQVPEEEEEENEEEEEKPGEDEGLLNGGESGDDLHNTSNEKSVTTKVDNHGIAKNSSEEEALCKEKTGDAKKECDHAECKEAEIDDWLFEFAQLFRNQVGIDPDAHLDLHELGMELCAEALEEAVTSDDAQNLFHMAAAKFQEVAALAFFNWGNVHMCAARKRIPLDESSPNEVMSAQLQTAYDWVRENYGLAAHRYEEAIRIKPDFYEGLLALGQQQFESAKLHWSFALASKIDLSAWDPTETLALFDSAEEKMKAATEMWEKVEEQRNLELKDPGMGKKDEILKRRKKQGMEDNQGELSAEEAADQAAVMRSQIHLFWGNMLFERSQVEFKLEFGNWKKNLDAAVERFKQAGASEAEISVVLKNHASNGTEVACEDKNVTNLVNDASESNVEDEDKHVLEG